MKTNYKFYVNYLDQNGNKGKYSFTLTSLDFFEADDFAQNKCKQNGWTYLDVESK